MNQPNQEQNEINSTELKTEKNHNYFYKVINLLNNHFYYGVHSTDNLDDGYMGSGRILLKAIKKYGKENFIKEIIADYSTRREASDHERLIVNNELINNLSCYNCRSGGDNNYIFSNEHRKKLSNARQGKKHSEETKLKMRNSQVGERGNNFGKKASEETRRKLREARQRNKHIKRKRDMTEDEILKNRKQATCKPCNIMGVSYISIRDACRQLNLSRSTIKNRIKSGSTKFSDWKYEIERNL